MNELLFFLHVALAAAFAFGALRLGKEALCAYSALLAALANFFVLKQTELFGLSASCGDIFAVASLLSLNLLQEHFGKEAAQKAIRISFFSMLFFGLISQIHLAYRPGPADFAHEHYASILGLAPRLFFASVASFFFVQQADIKIFSWASRRLKNASLGLRSCLTLAAAETLDTVLFSLLGLWGAFPNLGSIFLASLLIKLAAVFALFAFSLFRRRASHAS